MGSMTHWSRTMLYLALFIFILSLQHIMEQVNTLWLSVCKRLNRLSTVYLYQWLYHWSSSCDVLISDNEHSNSRLDALTKLAINQLTGALWEGHFSLSWHIELQTWMAAAFDGDITTVIPDPVGAAYWWAELIFTWQQRLHCWGPADWLIEWQIDYPIQSLNSQLHTSYWSHWKHTHTKVEFF